MKRILLAAVGTLALAYGHAQAQTANATTNAPAYTQGTQALSQDLTGHLRTTDSGTGSTISSSTPATAPADGVLVNGMYNSSHPNFTNGQAGPLQLDNIGNLRVDEALVSVMTAVNVTTSATAGVSSTIAAAAAITRGFSLQNTCATAIWWSNVVAVGTALTAVNSFTLAPGAQFTSPDWWGISGALTVASATAVACTVSAEFK